MAVREVKARSASDPAYQWDLRPIFPSDEAWYLAMEQAPTLLEKVRSYEGKLCESAEALLAYMDLGEEISETISRIYGYASLRSDEDTAVAKYQDMRSKAQNLAMQISMASAFATPEILSIEDETLEGFYAAAPGLEKYRIAIEDIRRMRPHVLSHAEEALLASAGEMADSPYNIFNLFEGADLKFPSVVDSQGEVHLLTTGTFIPLMESTDRALRSDVFQSYYKVFYGMQNTAAAMLDAQMKQLQFFTRARHYDSSLQASLDHTNVPVAVYESLLEAVDQNLPKLHRYMELRRKIMGLDELHMYDLYAPLVPEARVEIPYAQAQETVLEALAVLGEEYVSVIRRAFDERWIDVYENTGKRSGAYSSGLSTPHPYILLNHKDTLDSEFTLVHELGHTMHSYLSAKNQPVVYADYVIFVAEVASTVNESLLMQHLLAKTTDKKERASMINYFLEQFRTTLYRQAMFAQFEKDMGEMAGRGDALTAEALRTRYLELNRRYYGDAVCVDDEIAMEWARIPHFYYNYYVFQYATGFSAAMAISRRILREGQSAVDDYLRFLSSGCSKTPIELLKIAGVDMTTPQPIQDALQIFDELISEMETLTDSI